MVVGMMRMTMTMARPLALALPVCLLVACSVGDERPPAWDPELGGSTGEAGRTEGGATTTDAPGEDTEGETVEPVCLPGEVTACACPDGLSIGERVCDADGLGFGPCECDDAGGDTTGDTGDGGDSSGGEPEGDQVCYPGMANDWTTCLPLHTFEVMPAGYEYPPPYNGDPNYRAPIALLDLEEVDPATFLAPNFQLVEIAQASKGRYAVVQPHAIVSLQELRDQAGAIGVNSGYRSPAYNAGLSGSATYSRHMYGDGFDLNPLAVSIDALEGICSAHGGMLVEYTTHVHCDFRFDPVDEEFFGAPMSDDPTLRPVFTATLQRDDDGTWRAPASGFDEGEPQRRWVARDATGEILGKALGPTFVPPAGTATVEVRVGTQVERTAAVPRDR